MSILGSDPFNVLLYQQGFVGAPLVEGGATGADQLDVEQRAVTIGDVIPIVFCRRVGDVGGVLISPAATEARFENNVDNEVTASYHVVLGEGVFDGVQVRDVFQRSCRVGTFTQTYGRRAGPWIPGNFIVPRVGFLKPECPYYCGTGGIYEGMTTGSYVIENVPDGDTRWDRQIHLFIRGGMHVPRLLDSVTGPSNNIADLVLYFLKSPASRTPLALIDTDSLLDVAEFTDNLGLWFNGELNQSGNIEDFLANYGRDFLLTKMKRGGKIGLRPLLPVTAENEIDTSPITPAYTFTEFHIKPGSFEISFVPLAERKPFCALMLWRQQPEDDVGIIRTTEVRYAGTAIDGPYEQHDLSLFCASENHVVKSGAYKIAKRRYVSHTLRIRTKPGVYAGTLVQGDVVRVRMDRITSSAAPGVHDYLYEVDRIKKSQSGEVSFDLIHFPVDAENRSLVALDVVAATGGGLILPTGKSGTSCDVNLPDDETVPPDDSLDPDEWELPDDGGFGVDDGSDGADGEGLPDSGYGSGSDSDGEFSDGGGGGGGGGGGEGGEGGEEDNPPEELDDQDEIPGVGGVSPGGPIPGDTLTWPGCGCEDLTIEWFLDGAPVGSGPTFLITPAMMQGELVGVGKCNGVDTCETPTIPIPMTPEAYTYWRFKSTSGSASDWANTATTYGGFINAGPVTPGGLISWYIHSGKFAPLPPATSVGGSLGTIGAFSLATNGLFAVFGGYIGAANIDPASSTDFASPGSWEFSMSNADNGVDAWEMQWTGADAP
jgi:uncharacterized membrane protein YgcG